MSEPDIDKGWAWVILLTAFCGMFFNGIMIYSTGVIMAAMLQEIDDDLTRVSWVASLFGTTMCSSGLLVGVVTNRYGCRVSAITGGIVSLVGLTGAYFSTNVYHLIPTFSILAGIGVGFILCTAVVISGYHFKQYRALACGVAASGAGCGMFVGPPVIRLLIDEYTLKGAFLILGAILSNNCVFGMLMRPSPTETDNIRKSANSRNVHVENKPSKIKNITAAARSYCLIFKNIPFLSYIFSTFALSAGESAALLHLPNYAEQQGTSKMAAATLMTATGSTSLISRLLIGFAASDPQIGPEILHVALSGVIGLLTVTFPLYSHSVGTQTLYAAGYGMYSGGINTLVNPITAELVSLEHLASGFGVLAFTAGLGVIAGTPIAGIIVDSGGSYTISYIYAGSMLLVASFVAVPIALKHDKNATPVTMDAVEMDVEIPAEVTPLTVVERNDDVESISRAT